MTAETFDLIVIGAGPGGYVAAIKAAQLGLKTACVEKRSTLGGTCLNVGCIPSKALLHASEYYHAAKHEFADYGIDVAPKLNLARMMKKKDEAVSGLTKGVEYLFTKNKVTSLNGMGRIVKAGEVEVTAEDGSKTTYSCKNILIATGSDVTSLPGIDIDEKNIVSSTGALELSEVPKTLAVIGGGVIGLELGSVWARLGAKVTVLEYADRLLSSFDKDVAKVIAQFLKKEGIEITTGVQVVSGKVAKKGVDLDIKTRATDEVNTENFDKVLVSIGRKPYTEGLGLEELGVQKDERGFIAVNDRFETSVSGVFAIGDCVPGPMLAHKAEEEGVACVEMMVGRAVHINHHTIPGVVYTHPEIANVGYNEDQLKEAGVPYKVGKFPLVANSRAKSIGQTTGLVKLLTHKETDQVLGAYIVSPAAGEMIHEVVTIMEFGGSAEDIARTCHAHPTFSEAIKEAALACGDGTINM